MKITSTHTSRNYCVAMKANLIVWADMVFSTVRRWQEEEFDSRCTVSTLRASVMAWGFFSVNSYLYTIFVDDVHCYIERIFPILSYFNQKLGNNPIFMQVIIPSSCKVKTRSHSWNCQEVPWKAWNAMPRLACSITRSKSDS